MMILIDDQHPIMLAILMMMTNDDQHEIMHAARCIIAHAAHCMACTLYASASAGSKYANLAEAVQ